MRGKLYYDRGEFDLAITDFTSAIDANHNYLDAYFYKASANIEKGNLDEAMQDCNSAISVDQNYGDAHLLRGYILDKKGMTEAAIGEYMMGYKISKNEHLRSEILKRLNKLGVVTEQK